MIEESLFGRGVLARHALLLGASLALPACSSCDDGATAGTGGGSTSSATGGAPTDPALGQACASKCAEGECLDFDDQDPSNDSSKQKYCSRSCTSQADCTDSTRCTTTPTFGPMCLLRCTTNEDCPGSLACAHAGAERVCWSPNLGGGEIKLKADLAITEIHFGGELFENSQAIDAGAWRLVPGVPMSLTVGVRNRGSLSANFTAALRSESSHVDVILAAATTPMLPQKLYGPEAAIPPASGWFENFEIVAKDDIPIGVPQPMVLVMTTEKGIEEYALAFNVTSVTSPLAVKITSIDALTPQQSGDETYTGYILHVYGEGEGIGGFIATKASVLSGATELPVPDAMWIRYMNPQWQTHPLFGIGDPTLPHTIKGPVLLGVLKVDALAPEYKVEVRESPSRTVQATLAPTTIP